MRAGQFLTSLPHETVSQLPFCHNLKVTRSVQAKRDTESRIINEFWMPACAGMTTFILIPPLRHSLHMEAYKRFDRQSAQILFDKKHIFRSRQ